MDLLLESAFVYHCLNLRAAPECCSSCDVPRQGSSRCSPPVSSTQEEKGINLPSASHSSIPAEPGFCLVGWIGITSV